MSICIQSPHCLIAGIVLMAACSSDTKSTSSGDAIELRDSALSAVSDGAAVLMSLRPEITVYKSPTCGCCTGWVSYLEDEGFVVNAIDHDDVDSIKAEQGLHDPALKSCHTALVDGYVIEGHVPVSDIERLLREKPNNITGITAPGMPMLSPGMGSRIPKDYAVLSFTKSGDSAVYSQY